MRLLVVEDDRLISDHIDRGLNLLGHEVSVARCGEQAIAASMNQHFDAVVLDRMLPDMAGIDVLQRLRAAGRKPPVLILSALSSVEDRIEGLEAGADDYLSKPFNMAELSARLNAIVRRQPRQHESSDLVVGDLRLDVEGHKATYRDTEIGLNRKQFSLLAHLMLNADRLVTRGMLIEHVWGYTFQPVTNIVESNMSRLRSRLVESGCDPIETQRGSGYILRSARCA